MRKIFIIMALAALIMAGRSAYSQEGVRYIVLEEDGHNITVLQDFIPDDNMHTFLFPGSTAVDNAGNLYVIEASKYTGAQFDEVYIASPDNTEEPYKLFASSGDYDGRYIRIKGIDFDHKGNMFCVVVKDHLWPAEKAIIMIDGFEPAASVNGPYIKHPWQKKHQ